jgi:hypothetical protein
MQIKPIIVMLATLWHPFLLAAEAVPTHLAGTWGTGESLQSDEAGQAELYLAVDGFGVMAGSTSAPVRADGQDDGKPAPRGVIGFPVRAVMEGDALKLRLELPGKNGAKLDPRMFFLCRHAPEGPTLRCTGPDGKAMVMKRRSETVSPEGAKLMEDLRRLFRAAAPG